MPSVLEALETSGAPTFKDEYVVMHGGTIQGIFTDVEEAYLLIMRAGWKNAHIIPPDQNRVRPADEARKMMPGKPYS